MSEFKKLASLQELATGKLMRISNNNTPILLAYVDGKVYAVDDTCSHEDASL